MLTERVTLGDRLTLVGGKGGTGKTTVAAIVAAELARRGERVLVVSVDPAHSLGDALQQELGPEPRALGAAGRLRAMELDAAHERRAFLAEAREPLQTLLERGTYLDAADVDELLELAVPGLDELAAVLRLARAVEDPELGRLVVDTAPTGHTLRLLETPGLLRQWLESLRGLGARDDAVRAAFAPAGQAAAPDEGRELLERVERRVERLWHTLRDARLSRFVLVTTPESAVQAETERLRSRLAQLGIPVGGCVVNHCRRSESAGRPGQSGGADGRAAYLPALRREPRGTGSLLRLGGCAADAPPPARRSASPAGPAAAGLRLGAPFRVPRGRTLYLVGGKGGVGKTTIASALASSLAADGAPVLLFSVDPAGSLNELWGADVGRDARAAPGVEGLMLRQLDAAAEWASFRERYLREAEPLVGAALGTGAPGAPGDARRLLELAPPGIDELVALAEAVDLLEGAAYNAVLVDTAPTGHLLRLLESPDLALAWAHGVMRLLLRYREVIGLGEFAERLLRFAYGVRRLHEQLRDSARTWLALIALPQALPAAETRRLIDRLRGLGVPVDALIVNRLINRDGAVSAAAAAQAARLWHGAAVRDAVAAPLLQHGPRGAAELRGFAAGLRRVVTG